MLGFLSDSGVLARNSSGEWSGTVALCIFAPKNSAISWAQLSLFISAVLSLDLYILPYSPEGLAPQSFASIYSQTDQLY